MELLSAPNHWQMKGKDQVLYVLLKFHRNLGLWPRYKGSPINSFYVMRKLSSMSWKLMDLRKREVHEISHGSRINHGMVHKVRKP